MSPKEILTKMVSAIIQRPETQEAYRCYGGKNPMDYNSIVRIVHNKALLKVDRKKDPSLYEPFFLDKSGKSWTTPDVFGLYQSEGEELTKFIMDPKNTKKAKLVINEVLIELEGE